MTFRIAPLLAACSLAGLGAGAALAQQTQAPATGAPAAGAATAAPATPQLAPGVQVYDTQGNPVGTIVSVEGAGTVLKTDKYEVRLPVASYGQNKTGVVVAMTQAELNATVEQELAKAEQMLAPGSVVRDTAGGVVGTIDEVDEQFVTVKLASGKAARLPRSGFAAGPSGPIVGITAAQLEAQLAGAGA